MPAVRPLWPSNFASAAKRVHFGGRHSTYTSRHPIQCTIRFATTALPPRPTVDESEITEKFLKGTGPGGQKINKTNSAVQLIHLPTGLVIKCQATRSRDQNRKLARRQLAEALELREKGDESRIALKLERAKTKKASADKKKRRKYRALEEASAIDPEANAEFTKAIGVQYPQKDQAHPHASEQVTRYATLDGAHSDVALAAHVIMLPQVSLSTILPRELFFLQDLAQRVRNRVVWRVAGQIERLRQWTSNKLDKQLKQLEGDIADLEELAKKEPRKWEKELQKFKDLKKRAEKRKDEIDNAT